MYTILGFNLNFVVFFPLAESLCPEIINNEAGSAIFTRRCTPELFNSPSASLKKSHISHRTGLFENI
jgi:hypothetical protein